MPQIPHLTIRGKPIAQVYEYPKGIINVRFADWKHQLKRGLTRQAVIDWATEKYCTNNVDIMRFPEQPEALLEENEHEAMRVAFMKRLRIAAEDGDDPTLADRLIREDDF